MNLLSCPDVEARMNEFAKANFEFFTHPVNDLTHFKRCKFIGLIFSFSILDHDRILENFRSIFTNFHFELIGVELNLLRLGFLGVH